MMDMGLDIKLNNGRLIVLDEFIQGRTYASLFDGKIKPEISLSAWKHRYDLAKKMWGTCAMCTVFPIDYEKSAYEELPGIICAGRFLSFDAARDPKYMASELVLVWFEQSPNLHMNESNVELCRKIPWEQLATDFDW